MTAKRLRIPRVLRKYLKDPSLDFIPDALPASTEQERVFVAITPFADGLCSARLLGTLGESEILNGWFCENFAPIPLLSIKSEEFTASAFQTLSKDLGLSHHRSRIVCGTGPVMFGAIGSKHWISHGSLGGVVEDVLEGCVVLSRDSSWVDLEVAGLLSIGSGTEVKVGARRFRPI